MRRMHVPSRQRDAPLMSSTLLQWTVSLRETKGRPWRLAVRIGKARGRRTGPADSTMMRVNSDVLGPDSAVAALTVPLVRLY